MHANSVGITPNKLDFKFYSRYKIQTTTSTPRQRPNNLILWPSEFFQNLSDMVTKTSLHASHIFLSDEFALTEIDPVTEFRSADTTDDGTGVKYLIKQELL